MPDLADPPRPDAGSSQQGVDLSEVRRRRAGVRAAMGTLESAAAAPLTGRAAEWRAAVSAAMGALHAAWTAHVTGTEGDDGLFAQVRDEAPRLDGHLGRLHREHLEIAREVVEVVEVVEALDADAAGHDLEHVRRRVTDLLAHLARHRQRGADLIYEAYEVDIGAGD